MKTETKDELRTQISALQAENIRLYAKIDEEKRQRWNAQIPQATKLFMHETNELFSGMVYNPRLDHVDASGFWFSFSLTDDPRPQRYCVRRNELI